MVSGSSDRPDDERDGPDDTATGARKPKQTSTNVSGTMPRMGGARRETLPRMLGERYRLEELIAKGGMGRVYRATQLPLEREVAVKVMVAPPEVDADFRRRFLLEASVCARLKHPNIVVVHDYGEGEAGELYMAMELLDGEPLNALLSREGPLEPGRAVRIALQIARALRAAHGEGIAHRDLKPGNVFVDRQLLDDEHEVDSVKVLDFGLVKVYDDGRPSVENDLTEDEMMLGSPRYMSPEQILCEAVDARTDIYSFGVLLFTMLADRPPFIGRSPMDVLTQHLQRPPPTFDAVFEELTDPPPWEIPAQLEAVAHRCMAKDVEDRFQDVDGLIHALKQVRYEIEGAQSTGSFDAVSSDSISSSGPRFAPADPGAAGRSGSRRWLGMAALLGGVAIVAAAIALAIPERPAQTPARPPAPAEPAPAEPTTAPVTVTSDPPGAEVTSGGVLLGHTPLTRTLPLTPEGASRVFELRLDGYEPGRTAHAIEGDRVEVHLALTPTPPVTEPETEDETEDETEVEDGEPDLRRRRAERRRRRRRAEARAAAEAAEAQGAADPSSQRPITVDQGSSRIPIVD